MSKIPAIVAIRNNNEVKIKSKKMKCPKLVSKLFGIGGEIAYKNLKRSKKKYRTTVISIVLSVTVFISLSTFINYGFKITGQYYKDYNYNVYLRIMTNDAKDAINAYQEIVKSDLVTAYSIHRTQDLAFDPKIYYDDDAFYRAFGNNKDYFKNEDLLENIEIKAIGVKEYEKYLKAQGLSKEHVHNKGILIDNYVMYNNETEKYEHFNMYDLNKTPTIKGKIGDTEIAISLIRAPKEARPMGLENLYNQSGTIIVSEEYMDNLNLKLNIAPELYLKSENADELVKEINTFTDNHFEYKKFELSNIDEFAKAQVSFIILVSIFLYGFIIVISLIGVTNIFNTLTTNMNLRSKEFAMLKSVGMTTKEFNKMIRLESLMYGTKSLLIGIPLGIGGGYLIYKAFATGNDMHFSLPIYAIIISVVVVYLLVGLIMHFSLKKTKKQNIIETIRKDNI